jgi:pullulanase
MTLRDKLARVFGTGPDSDRVDGAVRAGISVTMLAHGIPFIEGGIEIGRTKGGNHNSYNAGDKVNQYVWRTLTPADAQCISHTSGLAAVRKAHPAFRSNTRLTGASQIKLLRTGLPDHVLAWELDGAAASDPWKTIRVIINLSQKRVDITGMERWQLGYSDDALGLRASAGAGMIWQLEPGGTVVLYNS